MSIDVVVRPLRSAWKRLSSETRAGALIVAVVHAFAIPRSFWEFDEALFAAAVWNYDPWVHNPPPPGYPLFIGIAKVFNFFLRDPLTVLLAVSFIATLIGFIALCRAFGEIAGDDLTGVVGAFLFYLSPAMLIHSTLPISDALALCFFAFSLLASARVMRELTAVHALLFGAAAGLTVGVRQQLAIIILPLLVVTLLLVRGWRARGVMVAAFTIACLAWFIPLMIEVGGPGRLYEYELGQAVYYASHDASISRGGWSLPKIAGRFIARPWGSVWFAAVVLSLAAAGFFELMRRRMKLFAPLAVGGAAYLGFAIATMDPADGARYALPSVVWVALMAGAGLTAVFRVRQPASGVAAAERPPRDRVFSIAAALLIAGVSVGYTSSLIAQRSTTSSPPARAAKWIRDHVPQNGVILVELPLWPQARYWLADRHIRKIDEAYPLYVRRPDVPLFVYGNGASSRRAAATFRWETSQAYEKLTRNHYRVVSVVPWNPEFRYLPVRGVYGAERDADEAWRWVAPEAEIVLPDVGKRRVRFELSLTRTAPIANNRVDILMNGKPAGSVIVSRGKLEMVDLPISPGENRLEFRAAASFVPAELNDGVGDPRRLAVRLMTVTQH